MRRHVIRQQGLSHSKDHGIKRKFSIILYVNHQECDRTWSLQRKKISKEYFGQCYSLIWRGKNRNGKLNIQNLPSKLWFVKKIGRKWKKFRGYSNWIERKNVSSWLQYWRCKKYEAFGRLRWKIEGKNFIKLQGILRRKTENENLY